MTYGKLIAGAGALLLLIVGFFILNPTFSVDRGYEGVVLTWGNPTSVAGPGLHFRVPIAQSVIHVSTQSHFFDFDEESYSRDQQPAQIKFSVSFHTVPGEAVQIVSEYSDFDKLVNRVLVQKSIAVFKNVFGTYNAETAVQQRAKLNADVLTAIQSSMNGTPLVVESVQVKDIKFSADYEAAIAAKQQAAVAVQTRQQELEQEKIRAQIAVTQAQARADSQLAEATAQAEAVRIRGEADASAIQAKGAALRDNPTLIDLTKAERWNGALPTTMIPDSTIPFLNTNSAGL